jgi:uncharacterized protein (TIGR00369 family)
LTVPDLPLHYDPASLSALIDTMFHPGARARYGSVVSVEPGHVRLSLTPPEDCLRPGAIVSGPTLMGLADVGAFAVIAAHLGPVTMALTTTLTINFLRAAHGHAPLIADAHLLKLGRRLASAEVRLSQERVGLVAQATVGFALPDEAAP